MFNYYKCRQVFLKEVYNFHFLNIFYLNFYTNLYLKKNIEIFYNLFIPLCGKSCIIYSELIWVSWRLPRDPTHILERGTPRIRQAI